MLWENQGMGIERDTHLWGRSRVYSSCATGGQVCSGSRSNPGWWCRRGSTTAFLYSPGDPPTITTKNIQRVTPLTMSTQLCLLLRIFHQQTRQTHKTNTQRELQTWNKTKMGKSQVTQLESWLIREREKHVWLFCSLVVHRDIYFVWNSLDLDGSGCCGVEARKPLVSFRLAVGAKRHRQGAVLQQANQPHRVAALRVA